MANVNIDLGQSEKELYGGSISAEVHKTDSAERICYPSFHVSGTEELPIAKKGTMVIEYEITSENESSRTRNGETTESYDCNIDVKRIISATPEEEDVKAPARSGSEAADALDAIAESLRAEEEGETD